MEFLVTWIVPFLISFIPIMIYVHRGRKSGKTSPKLAATLLALGCIGIPWTCMGIILRFHNLPYWGVGLIAFLLFGLAVYIGPFGIGLTGRWDNYVYPERKKAKGYSPVVENKSSDIGINTRRQASWRLFIWKMVLGEMVVFVGSGLVFQKTYLIIAGIAIAVIHAVIFFLIWYRKSEQLKENGWRW